MDVQKYRKKPIVIDAIQFDGNNHKELIEFCPIIVDTFAGYYVNTLEGDMHVSVGDWLIKGVQGEFYPCKPGVFEQSYSPVEEQNFGLNDMELRVLQHIKDSPEFKEVLEAAYQRGWRDADGKEDFVT